MRAVRSAPLLLAFALVVACDGEPTPVSPSNAAPVYEGEMPWIQVRAGGEASWFSVSEYFSDPDGNSLTFAAVPGNPAVASVAVESGRITVTPMQAGRTTVTVTASDPTGSSVQGSLVVTVRRPARGSFNIDLILAGDPVTQTQAAAFERAVDYWMAILADSELEDVALGETARLGCGVDTAEQRIPTADDLVIVANVRQTNRRGLAFGGPCSVRNGSGLPFTGRIIVSTEALDGLEDQADLVGASGLELLENLILHEIGHVLGIGTLWDDLIGGSASDDPHFTGALAIAAFDAAGGDGYTDGAKVPVEKLVEAHWRQDVFEGAGQAEVMTPIFTLGASLSAITIQSLADLGYTVDVSLAQPYRLPVPELVTAGAGWVRTARASVYRFGDDIMRGPVVVVEADGTVVRVIPGR